MFFSSHLNIFRRYWYVDFASNDLQGSTTDTRQYGSSELCRSYLSYTRLLCLEAEKMCVCSYGGYRIWRRLHKLTMPYFSCCVPGCTASKRKLHQLEKYPWMKDVSFVSLPDKRRNKREYQKWLRLIRREASWKTTKYTRICSLHFVKGESSPTLFPYNNFKKCTVRLLLRF